MKVKEPHVPYEEHIAKNPGNQVPNLVWSTPSLEEVPYVEHEWTVADIIAATPTVVCTSPHEIDKNGAIIVPMPGLPTQADIDEFARHMAKMGRQPTDAFPPYPTLAKEWRAVAADENQSSDVRRQAAARADRLDGLFIVHVHPGTMQTTVDEVERVLLAAGRGLYQRRNEIVSAEQAKIEVRNSKIVDSMIIVPRGARALVEDLSACAIIQRWDKREKKYIAIDAPVAVVQTLQQRIGRLNFPVLTGLVFAPTMRPDGSVIDTLGNDSDTGLLFNPMGVAFPPVPHSPSMPEAHAALGILSELISDFPFIDSEGTDGASKSAALSAILTACARPAFPHAPLHAFTAPTAGTGKSKLVDIASVLAKGHECRVTAMGRTGEELEKRLGSLMIEGDNFITIDNCEWPLGNDFLCQMLTQPVLKPRILGKSESPECSATKMFVGATGNNLQITGDLTRRALLCSLDAGVERPELREFDVEPVAEAKQKRPQLVVAALTALRGYITAGCPDQNITHLGSFEEWSKLVRSALLWLGYGDQSIQWKKLEN